MTFLAIFQSKTWNRKIVAKLLNLFHFSHVLDQAIYQPTRNILVNESTTLVEVCQTSNDFMKFCMFDETDEDNLAEWDMMTIEERKSTIEGTIIDDMKGSLWNHCKRSLTNSVVRGIAHQLACGTISGRALGFSEMSFPEFNDIEKSWWRTSADFDACEEEVKEASSAENLVKWGRIRENLRDSRLVVDLAGLCNATDVENVIASKVHTDNPMFVITKKAFATEKLMDDYQKDETSNLNELERRLASIVFTTADFDTKKLEYALRLPPSRRNIPPGRFARFGRPGGRRPGENWKPTLLKRLLQLAIPVRQQPSCSGGVRTTTPRVSLSFKTRSIEVSLNKVLRVLCKTNFESFGRDYHSAGIRTIFSRSFCSCFRV